MTEATAAPVADQPREGRYRLGGLLLALAVLYLVGEYVAVQGFVGNRPYRWGEDAISALGVPVEVRWGEEVTFSSRHVLMNATFVLTGVRTALAALVLAPFAARRGRLTVLVLSVLYGAGWVTVGVFPTGPGTGGTMHGVGAVLVFFGGTLLLLALTVNLFGRHPRLAGFTALCLVVAAVGLVGMPMMIERFGLFERLNVDPVMVWQVVAGIAVLASRPPSGTAPEA